MSTALGDAHLKQAMWTLGWLTVALYGPVAYYTIITYIGIPYRPWSAMSVTLWAIAAAVLVLAATNPLTHVLWTGLDEPARAGEPLCVSQTPLMQIAQSYGAVTAVIAIVVVVRGQLRAPRFYRRIVPLLVISVLVPIAAGIPSTLGDNVRGAVFGVFGLVFASGILLWCIARRPNPVQRYGFLQATRETVVDVMTEGVIVISGDGVVADQNPAAAALLGLAAPIVGRPADEVLPAAIVAAVAAETPDAHSFPYHHPDTDTTLDLTVTRVGGANRERGDVIVVMRDGSERARAIARLDHLAHNDTLTGLPNRTRLEQELAARIDEGVRLALILLDLDGFKAINDTFGHASGDDLLREAGRRLRDLNVPDAFVARLGGDEFVLMVAVEGDDHAKAIAERVASVFDQDIAAAGHTDLRINASVGVAIAPRHGRDGDALLRCADVAMYYAKRTGRRVHLYDQGTDPNTPERLRQVSDLRGAVPRGEMELHYQPVFDLRKRRAAGAEALLRWRHPTRGLLYPGQFLPEVDEAGIGRELARWVIGQALSDRAAWPVGEEGFQVAFNLSAKDLSDAVLIDDLLDILARSPVHPHDVVVEVTEMVFLTSLQDAEEHRSIERLRAAGVRLVLDDFGTGHASVTMLRDLRGAVAKLGGVFVVRMRHDPDDFALVQGLTDLALHLNYAVLAEWVEDRETLAMLYALGCRFAQGFYLARPMTSAALSAWLPGNSRSGSLRVDFGHPG